MMCNGSLDSYTSRRQSVKHFNQTSSELLHERLDISNPKCTCSKLCLSIRIAGGRLDRDRCIGQTDIADDLKIATPSVLDATPTVFLESSAGIQVCPSFLYGNKCFDVPHADLRISKYLSTHYIIPIA